MVFAHNIEAIRQFVSFIFQVKVFPPEIYFLTLKNYQSYFNPLIGLSLDAEIAGYKLAKNVISTEKKQIIRTDL